MPRITRIAGSFAIVMIAYWLYALAVVPWIEPSAGAHANQPITDADRTAAEALADVGLKQLEGLLPPGVLDPAKTKILALDDERAKLLFQEYHNLGDGGVRIAPCTIVFAHDGPARDEQQRRRQSIILEAPGGALLKFDQPLNLNQARVGRLVGGQLNGPVTIRSDWKEPGPEDDLWIRTSDVRLCERTVATSEPVDFRWGPHFGHGRDMVIQLLSGPPKPGMDPASPNIAGVEFFELRRIERLHLDLGRLDPGAAASSGSVPTEIRSRGPFRFDVVCRAASFCGGVDVMVKEKPSLPADQVACETLNLHFARRGGDAPAQETGSLDLVAQRLEAEGRPVVVTAPGRNLVSRAERFQYDLQKQALTLDGAQEVFIQQGPNEIHARNIYYQAGEGGRLGQAAAQGPGWLRGQSPDRAEQQLEAAWTDQMRIDRDQGQPLISLGGGAELRFPGVGQLQSRDVFLWLQETMPPSSGGPVQWQPQRMAARGNVHMNSPQLAGKFTEMQVWFDSKAEGGGRRAETSNGGQSLGGLGGSPPIQPANQPNRFPGSPSLSRFEASGRLLRAQVLLGPRDAALSNLTIDENVRFVETQTQQPGQRPLAIFGDRLEAADVSATGALVTVSGRPARLEGRGLGLNGAAIRLDRAANRLWIDGPGRMDMPLAFNPQNPAAESPGLMTVDWQRRMTFDGASARFEQSVVGSARNIPLESGVAEVLLNTDVLEVRMQRPVDFIRPGADASPTVETLQCSGGVLIESRSFDLNRQLTSHDWMQLTDLGVNVQSGQINGGPGWLNSVYRGSAGSPSGGTMIAPAAAANPDQLYSLRVRFQKSITGNVHRRALVIDDRVLITHAPVGDWDAMLMTDNPDQLGHDGVVAHCDRLSVAQSPVPLAGRRAIALELIDNAVVESAVYTARGHRITYDEAKDLLVLEGAPRGLAELFQQSQPGAAADKHSAQKILYWRKTGRVTVVGAQSFETTQPPRAAPLR